MDLADSTIFEEMEACARRLAEQAARDVSRGTQGIFAPSVKKLRPALFLDRDGVLVQDSGYMRDPDALVYKEDVLRGLADFACFQEQKVLLAVISNQAGIAKGIITRAEAEAVNERIVRRMREHGLPVAGVWYCPYHEEGIVPEYTRASFLRKPQPGMILLAAEALGIDIARSLMVGDKESDCIALPYLETYLLESHYLLHDECRGGSVVGLMQRIVEKFAPYALHTERTERPVDGAGYADEGAIG